MYDTTNIALFKQDYPDVIFIQDIPACLDSVQVEGESNQGIFINGMIGTFRVSVNPNRIKLQGSSLGRFINGDNQQGMSLQLTRQAIEKLSDQLHLDIGLAKVTRIDVGRNLITKYTPETYLPYLGENIGYKRHEIGTGLYYKNSLRDLVLYDKIREQKEKRVPIHRLFLHQNLLRYEMRLKNHLEQELKKDRVIARMLYDEAFYIALGRMWRDQYLKISKRSNKAALITPTASTRELIQALASMAIKDIGDGQLFKMVAEWQQQDVLTKKQASDHRKAIREAVRKEMKTQGNEMIDELTAKVKQATRFFI